jgi:hypothetical protein
MPHVDVHQGGSGKKVFRLSRDDGYLMIAELSDKTGGGDAADSVTDDGNMHNDVGFLSGLPPTGGSPLIFHSGRKVSSFFKVCCLRRDSGHLLKLSLRKTGQK